MTEQTPIRIGIAGAGRIVRDEHVPRLRAIEGVELVSVANQTIESSRRAASTLGIPRVATTGRTSWPTRISTPCSSAPGHTSTRRSRSRRSKAASTC